MPDTDITTLLHAFAGGNRDALDQLIPLVYEELHRLARAQLRHERPHHTLDSTALLHEAYLRLCGINRVQWHDRNHFMAVAARVMRRVLTDYARARQRDKRGAGAALVSLGHADGIPAVTLDDVLDLDETLARLDALNERACRVVECRCFAGLSVEETAEALRTSPATVKRDWAFSRAWLNRELRRDQSPHPGG